ncbi:hypothetical protein [Paenibacillus guangzhouensis]|uniref:hypothetical protein n=1 Tax=Paenibacillus guangzhouensis TaxID=1473112 RepID=UPI00187BA746|nr:hypothetical protein [Paenibacillus guangzhouensis]
MDNQEQAQVEKLKERVMELEAENARLKQLIIKLKNQRSKGEGRMSTPLREALRE